MKNTKINETAASGTIAGGSIAANLDTGAPRKRLRQFMMDFNNRIVNKMRLKAVKPFPITIKENFDIEDVISRLASYEKSGKRTKATGTTFGIEDDKGNIMRVTVRAEQAKDFEQAVAIELAEIETNVSGLPNEEGAREVSMAELLYKLNQKFDIIDVDFPKIPTDVVYNADKASYDIKPDMQANDLSDMEAPQSSELDMDSPLDLGDMTDDESEQADEIGGQPPELNADELEDDELVQDMTSSEEEPSTDSILDKVISMLKSQADAEKAKADAEAEKARADQARYTAQATSATISAKEEEMRYDLEQEQLKKREKEAQKMADMAKHRLSKTMGMTMGEGFLNEFDEMDSINVLRRQKAMLAQKFRIEPDDDQETRAYKNTQKINAAREIDAKLRQAVTKQRYIETRKKQDGAGTVSKVSPETQSRPNQQTQQRDQQGQI